MSLARALTKRMRSQEEVSPNASSAVNRAFSTRKNDKPIDRSKISLPLELISSSNALAYEAPHVTEMQAEFASQSAANAVTSPSTASSASSRKSYEDSMVSPGLSSASSITSNEMSRESSPVAPSHKQIATFFSDNTEPTPALPPTADTHVVVTPAEETTPDVPKRAPSHTKHQSLARQRSLRASNSSATAANLAPATRSSIDMFSAKPDADHPFGAELAKVNELAEEFGMKKVQILDEDSQYLADHGFHRFTADDYILEIQPLYAAAFPVPQTWL